MTYKHKNENNAVPVAEHTKVVYAIHVWSMINQLTNTGNRESKLEELEEVNSPTFQPTRPQEIFLFPSHPPSKKIISNSSHPVWSGVYWLGRVSMEILSQELYFYITRYVKT